MQTSKIPGKFPVPWASSAGGGFIRSIPTSSQISITPGAASLTDGFPPLNSIPVPVGGVPPFMQDFNGILNLVTAWLQWFQAGGPITYDASFANSVGGYPAGTIVQSATTPTRQWFSLIDNNTSNPDTGGAGWTIANVGRLINIFPLLVSGTYSYAPKTGTTFVIVTVVGAGGAGGGAGGSPGFYAVGSGGAAGSAAKSLLRSGFSGATIVVGAGGTPSIGGNGNSGGTSSFGSILSAPGGGGGFTAAQPTGQIGFAGQGIPGAPGVGGNIFNVTGQPGLNGLLQGQGSMSGQGGSSILGGGAENNSLGNGGFGKSPGAGGSGAGAIAASPGPFTGGAGANGAVIIEEWA